MFAGIYFTVVCISQHSSIKAPSALTVVITHLDVRPIRIYLHANTKAHHHLLFAGHNTVIWVPASIPSHFTDSYNLFIVYSCFQLCPPHRSSHLILFVHYTRRLSIKPSTHVTTLHLRVLHCHQFIYWSLHPKTCVQSQHPLFSSSLWVLI